MTNEESCQISECWYWNVSNLDVLFFAVGSGSRWKFSAVRGDGVCHSRDGWGGTASRWRQAAGWDQHPRILLCSWCSWKKHVGRPHCCPNNGIVAHWWVSPLVRLCLPLTCAQVCLVLPFKAVNRGKGLLPDPTVMQILTGLNNPAALKMLLNPMVQGNKQGKNSEKIFEGCGLILLLWILMFNSCPGLLGAAPAIPLLANPALSAALLQILLQNQAKVQQVLQSC